MLYRILLWNLRKTNSWTYNFIAVSGHDLESFQTWGFCMVLSTWKGGGVCYGFLSGFPLVFLTVYSNWIVETVRGCMSLKKNKSKSQGKAVGRLWIARRKTLKTFVWISSKNSASGQFFSDWACDSKKNEYEVRQYLCFFYMVLIINSRKQTS